MNDVSSVAFLLMACMVCFFTIYIVLAHYMIRWHIERKYLKRRK